MSVPLPAALGPHAVLGPLSAGGMAQVLRGRAPDGQLLALKLAPADRPSHRRALRQEAALLGSLAVPGLVSLVDWGEDTAGTWLATPLLAGVPGPHWLAADPSADARLTVALRLVETLAALHGAGVVHGDLKLANTVVDGDRPVLLDLGLARRGARFSPRAPGPGIAGGTPGWWAPEQRAGHVDSRTDTFALGRLLDELLPRPRTPELRVLLDALRQLHPDHRPPHVVQVARRLAALLGRPLSALPAAWPLPPPSLGREGLVARIEGELASGRAVALLGPSGVGRSHVLARLAATDRELLWVSGTGEDPLPQRPAGPCRVLVDDAEGLAPSARAQLGALAREGGVQVVVVAESAPDWAVALPVAPLAEGTVGELVDAALRPEAPAGAREAWVEAAAGRPGWLAAVLEAAVATGDLELGDVGRWLAPGRDPDAPWHARAASLSPSALGLLARLGRLQWPVAAPLAAAVAALPPARTAWDELERAGWLWREPGGRIHGATARAQSRAAALPLDLPAARLHRCAAGQATGPARAAHLHAAGDTAAAVALWSAEADRAVNAGQLEAAEHALRAALAALGPVPSAVRFSLLRRLAFRVVRVLRSPGEAVPLLEEAAALARRLDRPALEAQALRRLAMIAQYTGRIDDARHGLERARALALAGRDRVEAAYALADRGLVAHGTQDWPRARRLLEQALAELDTLPAGAGEGRVLRNRAVYQGSLGFCLLLLGQLDAADAALAAATAELRIHAGPTELAPVLANHARVLRARGELEASAEVCREAVRVAARNRSPMRESQARVQLAETCMALGRLAEADQELAAAWALARPLGIRTGEIYLWGRTGDLRWQQDRIADARAAYCEALACSADAGQGADGALCRVRIASCDRRLGHLDAAREGLETVRAQHAAAPLPPGTLVELLCEEGLADETLAQERLDAALALAAGQSGLEPHAEELLWTLEEALSP